jgi:hypothetical protein
MVLSNNKKQKSTTLLVIGIVITLFLWVVPGSFYGIPNLTLIEQRVIAIFFSPFLCGLQNVFLHGALPCWL